MQPRFFRSISLALTVGALMSTGAAADTRVVKKSVSIAEQTSAASYWTRERIGAAPVMAMPVDRDPDRLPPRAEPLAAGPGGSALAGMADANAAQIARSAYWQDWAPQGSEDPVADDVPAGTAGVFTAYDVNKKSALWKVYPHIWDGRLNFSTPAGGSSCSATVISGNNIVTAAHCVYDQATGFYSNWVFTPAYRKASSSSPVSAPYGTFTANTCWVLTTWTQLVGGFNIDTWTRHDVAVCKMNNNSAGQTLNGAVGWAGRMWDWGYQFLVFNSGYPARDYNDVSLPSSTQYLRACTAETFQRTTDTMGAGCSYGRGISGGSWLVGYQPFIVTGSVDSVNSGLFIGQPNLYGARFTSNNIVPLCNAAAC